MAQANPDYRYYKQLAGTWKDAGGKCIVTLTDTVGITVSYLGAVLEGYYGVTPVTRMTAANPQSPMGMGMMGFAGMPGGMLCSYHPNEDIQINPGDRYLKDGDQPIYYIVSAWHDISDKLHLEMNEVKTRAAFILTLEREIVAPEPLKEGECRCECGQVFSSRFCPNCGKQRPENNNMFQCECGYNGPAVNFCPNCGKLIKTADETKPAEPELPVENKTEKPEAGWTCSECGAKLQTGEKCAECGAEIKKELLFALSEYATCNPPRSDVTRVYKFSDTQLILEAGGHFRFIPATVIGPAMELIREHKIDKWEEYKDCRSGFMGGSQSVSYWDGEKMAGTSTDNMPEAGAAYFALRNLFTTATCQEKE